MLLEVIYALVPLTIEFGTEAATVWTEFGGFDLLSIMETAGDNNSTRVLGPPTRVPDTSVRRD
jgi:hypothetical protein